LNHGSVLQDCVGQGYRKQIENSAGNRYYPITEPRSKLGAHKLMWQFDNQENRSELYAPGSGGVIGKNTKESLLMRVL